MSTSLRYLDTAILLVANPPKRRASAVDQQRAQIAISPFTDPTLDLTCAVTPFSAA